MTKKPEKQGSLEDRFSGIKKPEKKTREISELAEKLGKAREISDLFEKSEKAWFKGKKIKLLERILKLEPDNRKALLALGELYERKKRFDAAISYYARVFGEAEELSSFLFNRAAVSKSHKLKLKYYSKAIELNPNNASAIHNLGLCYYVEAPEQAINYFKRAIAVQPNCLSHQILGQAYLRLNRYGSAGKELKKAKQLDPSRFSAYSDLDNLQAMAPHIGDDNLPLEELINISRDYLEKQRIKCGCFGKLVWSYASDKENSANKVIRFKGECLSCKEVQEYKPQIYEIQISSEGDAINSRCIERG